MKGKIIGIIVIFMLLTTYLTAAYSNDELTHSYKEIEPQPFPTMTPEVDVPVWHVDDKWVYEVTDLVVDFEENNQTIEFDIAIENFEIMVLDDTNPYYTVSINETAVTGSYLIDIDLGDGPVVIQGDLMDTRISGTLLFNKTDLAVVGVNVTFAGTFTVHILEEPYLNRTWREREIELSEFTLDIGFCDPYPVIDFPLNVTKFWGLPACNLTLDGQIQTQIFDKLDRWNDIIRRPLISRIIEFILNLTGMGDLLEIIHMVSDILDDILPILDIGYVLEEYLGVEEILVQPIPPIFVVTNCSETVTVPAGTFDVCNISVANLSSMYYAPDVKSFVKITGNFEDILPFVNNVEAVLISYELH